MHDESAQWSVIEQFIQILFVNIFVKLIFLIKKQRNKKKDKNFYNVEHINNQIKKNIINGCITKAPEQRYIIMIVEQYN